MCRALVVAVALGTTIGCGAREATVLPAPTPAIPNPPSITCPADLAGEAHVGKLPTFSFEVPAAHDGQPPVNVSCSAESGSEFPVGRTTITFEASDALARKATCSFTITVADIPRIEKTRFMAFGDSLTEGKVTFAGTDPVTPFNYESMLTAKLSARYELQSITMVKEPQSGEKTGDGKWRFAGAFDQARPEVVLLLEGTNDLLGDQEAATITSAVDSLENMVNYAKFRGAKVFIATLPPMNPSVFPLVGPASSVPMLNARIKTMAASQGIVTVDLEKAIPLSLIGPDGKHPTAQGYQKIADTFFDAIETTLEVKPSTPPQIAARAPGRL